MGISTSRSLVLLVVASLTIPFLEHFSDVFHGNFHLHQQLHSLVRRNEVSVAPDITFTPAPPIGPRASMAIEQARAIVENALDEIEPRNRARMEHPSRNKYKTKGASPRALPASGAPELYRVTDEQRTAAGILAEAEARAAAGLTGNSSSKTTVEPRQSGGFWMEGLKRQGAWPWGNNPVDFKVFGNVKDYGAKGDGLIDDAPAILAAIDDYATCTKACYGSTTKGAIIYFPAGTYLIASTLEINYGLQVIGDPNNRPKLITPRFFTGLGVFSTDKYWGDGFKGEDKLDHEYFNTANFYRQIRNFVIDISATSRPADMAGIHYQVSQATSLQNVKIIASTDDKTEQRCIFAENGSGGFMSDIEFNRGRVGLRKSRNSTGSMTN